MSALLLAVGVILLIAGLLILPVAAHAALEAREPRPLKRLAFSLLASAVNLGSVLAGAALIWSSTNP